MPIIPFFMALGWFVVLLLGCVLFFDGVSFWCGLVLFVLGLSGFLATYIWVYRAYNKKY